MLHVIDTSSKKQYALKYFIKQGEYEQEKAQMLAITKLIDEQLLQEIAAFMEVANDQLKVMMYSLGECSLLYIEGIIGVAIVLQRKMNLKQFSTISHT